MASLHRLCRQLNSSKVLKKMLVVFLLANLVGCSPNVSQSGISAVADFYGGKVMYKVGISASTKPGEMQGTYLELELENEKLEECFPKLSIPASNCAYLFYQSVSQDERDKYAFIKVAVKGKNSFYSQSFAMADLDTVDMAITRFDEFGRMLKDEQYDQLNGLMNGSYISPADYEGLKKTLQESTAQYGQPIAFQLQGFEFDEAQLITRKQRVLGFYAMLRRVRKNTLVSLTIDHTVNSGTPYVIGIE